jgi:hypothetical protein
MAITAERNKHMGKKCVSLLSYDILRKEVCVFAIVRYSPERGVCLCYRTIFCGKKCVSLLSYDILRKEVCVFAIVRYSPERSVCLCYRYDILRKEVCVFAIDTIFSGFLKPHLLFPQCPMKQSKGCK